MTDSALKAADASPSHNAAALFDWLSATFAGPPSVEAVAAHRRGSAAEWLSILADDPDLAPGVARMRGVLDRETGDDELAACLQRRYGLMFDGIGGPYTIPPCESAFRPGAAWRMFQEPAAEMQALLAERDLSVSDAALPPDHLAVELALAAHLAAAGDPEAEAMTARLAAWVPAFAAACAQVDEEGFWAAAAEILAAAVARGSDAPEIAERGSRKRTTARRNDRSENPHVQIIR